jgi:hypothetical protein
MFHGRRLFVAVLVGFAILGAAINSIGPFGAHPALTYARLLADFEAGRVDRIVRWRDRLEVTEGPEAFLVVVPEGADLPLDLAQARAAGGGGINFGGIPDDWLTTYTPWVPALLLIGGLIAWLPAVLRRRSGHGGSDDLAVA